MFSFIKFISFMALAAALPSPAPKAGITVERSLNVAPAGSIANVARDITVDPLAHVARRQADFKAALEARQLPTSVPDAVSTATDLLNPILAEIESAIASGAPVATLTSLWGSVLPVVTSLASDITGLSGLGSGALGGLSVSAVAQVFSTLIALVTTQLQSTVSSLSLGNTSAFTSIFTSVTNELISAITAMTSTIPGIGPVLSPLLSTTVSTLSSLAGILSAPLSLVLELVTLLLALL